MRIIFNKRLTRGQSCPEQITIGAGGQRQEKPARPGRPDFRSRGTREVSRTETQNKKMRQQLSSKRPYHGYWSPSLLTSCQGITTTRRQREHLSSSPAWVTFASSFPHSQRRSVVLSASERAVTAEQGELDIVVCLENQGSRRRPGAFTVATGERREGSSIRSRSR
jgi:hypothetical protein